MIELEEKDRVFTINAFYKFIIIYFGNKLLEVLAVSIALDLISISQIRAFFKKSF
jgi:hypothetical protein